MKISEQQITLLDSMGSDLSVVNAARVSFDKQSSWQETGDEVSLLEYSLADKDTKLISYLAKHNHWSPFAHASASFRVKAPIFVARQLVKHTVGFSWNEVSRRYVDSEPEFFMPSVWRKRAENVKQGSSEEAVTLKIGSWADYEDDSFLEYTPKECFEVCLHVYDALLAQGVCPEQARMVLPQNTMTEFIWTGTLYAWARMCKLRLDSHTQAETREIAQKVSEAMSNLFPVAWQALTEN